MLFGLPVDTLDYFEDYFCSEVANEGKEIGKIYILQYNHSLLSFAGPLLFRVVVTV
jgi:hypothetical protein